jgi:uncharacterized protein (DUF4415 family)
MEKLKNMTGREIQKKYKKEIKNLKATLSAAPEFDEDPNPDGKVAARGFVAFKKYINRQGRPKTDDKKVVVSFCIPSSDVKKLRAIGKGWQTKASDYLVQGIRHGKIENTQVTAAHSGI